MKNINLIAADIGAGTGRIFLAEFNGEKISSKETHRFENNSVLLGGTLFWDFLNIMAGIETGFKKAGSMAKSKIKCIGVDTWGADFGLLDVSGYLLSNPVSYRDWRTEKAKKLIYRIIDKKSLNELNSTLTYEYCTLFQLYHTFNFQKDIAELIDIYLPMPNLINYFLTGEKIVDPSILSGSQFYNVLDKKFLYHILEDLGINKSILPPVSEAGKILGSISKNYVQNCRLDCKTQVSLVCSHDTPSAVMGIPLDEERDGKSSFINSGTWSLLGMETGKPDSPSKLFNKDFTIWNSFRDKYITPKIFNGFYFLQECKKVWDTMDKEVSSYEQFYKNISGSASSRSLMSLNSRSLFELEKKMPDIIQEYFKNTGQTYLSSRDEIIASMMQSIVLEYKLAINDLEMLSDNRFEKIFMVGGGSLNKIFCQWVSDCLEKEVYTGYPESTINGNILAQLIAIGEISNLEEGRKIIKRSCKEVIYSPKKNVNIDWKKLEEKYRSLKDFD